MIRNGTKMVVFFNLDSTQSAKYYALDVIMIFNDVSLSKNFTIRNSTLTIDLAIKFEGSSWRVIILTLTNARATISRMSAFTIHSLSSYLHWVDNLLNRKWGSTLVVTRGKIHDASQLPGFFALQNGEPVGLGTFKIDGDQCEIVTQSVFWKKSELVLP